MNDDSAAAEPSRHHFSSSAETVRALAHRVVTALTDDIETHGDASLIVSGGRTPVALFGHLAKVDLDWSRVSITLADERWVPNDHPDSNEGLVRRTLMVGAASRARFVPLYTGHDSPEAGEIEAATHIASIRRPFSAVLLGMGTDGHFASCFPMAPNLLELLAPKAHALVRAVRPPNTTHPRITLTLSCLRQARLLALQIHGDEKRRVLESATENRLPVARLLTLPVDIFWSP